MAHHKSALKRIRQSKNHRLYNRQNKKSIRIASKAVFSSTNFDEAWEKFKLVTKIYDQAAARGVVHKNHAANHKSSLAKYVNSLKTEKV